MEEGNTTATHLWGCKLTSQPLSDAGDLPVIKDLSHRLMHMQMCATSYGPCLIHCVAVGFISICQEKVRHRVQRVPCPVLKGL